VIWNDAAIAQRGSRLRRGDSDSEGDNQASFFERQSPPGLIAGARVGWWGDEPKSNDGILGVRSGRRAATVLANKRGGPRHDPAAGAVGAHARGRRCVLVRARRRRGVGTPDLAQQAGVLPDGQRQYDRKKGRSKHVMLATLEGKSRASPKRRRRP
jgi:hypothetical protein